MRSADIARIELSRDADLLEICISTSACKGTSAFLVPRWGDFTVLLWFPGELWFTNWHDVLDTPLTAMFLRTLESPTTLQIVFNNQVNVPVAEMRCTLENDITCELLHKPFEMRFEPVLDAAQYDPPRRWGDVSDP